MSWMHWRDCSLERLEDGDLMSFALMLSAQTRNTSFLDNPRRLELLLERMDEVAGVLEDRADHPRLF
jgi:hypothetical protein